MGFTPIRTTVLLDSFPRSEHGWTPRQGAQQPLLPATLIFSSATKLGTAVVELVAFVPVPLTTRLSTFDSNLPMRCKILSNSTARVFFRSVKENAESLKTRWLLYMCLVHFLSSPLPLPPLSLTWRTKKSGIVEKYCLKTCLEKPYLKDDREYKTHWSLLSHEFSRRGHKIIPSH